MSTEAEQTRMRDIARRLGVHYPPTEEDFQLASKAARARHGSRSPGNTTSSSETPSRPTKESPNATGETPGAAMNELLENVDESICSGISDQAMDITERGLQRVIAQLQIENRALRAQIQTHKDRESGIIAQSVRMREQFSQASAQLANIKRTVRTELRDPINEEMYRKLEAIPEAKRDLSDVIRVVVYEQVGQLHASRSAAQEENQILKRELADLKSAHKSLRDRNEAMELEHKREVSLLQDNVERLTVRCDELQQTLSSSKRAVDANETKAARYDQMEIDLRKMEAQLKHAVDDANTFQTKYNQIQIEHQTLRDESQRDKSLLHNTQTELKFVSKERETISVRLHEVEQSLKRQTQSSEEKESSLQQTSMSAIQERESQRQEYEQRYNADLERLRAQHNEDIERLRTSARDSNEREQRTLREALEIAQSTSTKNRQQLDETRAELEVLKQQQLSKHEEAQREIFEQRMQLTNKANENMRLDLACRENEAQLERKTVDLQCCEKKLEILKQEFYDQKMKHQEVVLKLEAKLQAQENQIGMMRELETEAEVFMAHIATSSSADPAAIAAAASAVGGDVPASRRMAHTLSVTKRALALENQITLMKHDAGVTAVRMTKLENDLEMARNALRNSNSPYCLLEENLQRREHDLDDARTQLRIVREENEVLEKKNRQLDSEVQLLSGHRAEVARIRDMLKQLGIQQQGSKSSNKRTPLKALTPTNRVADDTRDEMVPPPRSAAPKDNCPPEPSPSASAFAPPHGLVTSTSPVKPTAPSEGYTPEAIEVC